MAFDWQGFLDAQGVEYIVGPAANIRSGHLGFPCPRCPNDQGNHYAVQIEEGKIRGCWRDPTHWMGSTELIATLASCSWGRAKEILDSGDIATEATTARALLASILQPEEATAQALELSPLRFPRGFQRFAGNSQKGRKPFDAYLRARGFSDPVRLTEDFGLRWSMEGRWKNRIIFPIWREGKLVGWTARAIGYAKAKYIAEPPGDAMQLLLWESRPVEKGDVLVLVEGSFDALKIADVLHDDIVAAALLTNSAGPEKRARIFELAGEAKRTIVLLDAGAETKALRLQSELAVLKPTLLFCPPGVDDPGDLSRDGVLNILEPFL